MQMDANHLYKDIQARTNGEIYIGVVGPVRTGKSTFIKRFMEILVLPNMKEEPDKIRTRDELPQSASGKTIMTTEPKFIPKDAAKIRLSEDTEVRVRLIDCVGYMVEGASGHMEEDAERQVKTPWYEQEIPFTKAASIGTRKVIREHATIGLVVTTDGSIGELNREQYREAEEKTIRELQEIGKPFTVIVNSVKPYSQEAKQTAEEIAQTWNVSAIPVNCEQLKEEDVQRILEAVLATFPVSEIAFYIPKWTEMLPADHKIRQDMILHIRELMEKIQEMGDAYQKIQKSDSPYITEMRAEEIAMDSGKICVKIEVDPVFYYEMLSEMTGTEIDGEYSLIKELRELSKQKESYACVSEAFDSVRMKGYGAVSPTRGEIVLDEPTVIRQGNKYGVKIHASAPSIHLIRADIETEIAPIVGNEKQAEDLISYIHGMETQEEGIWKTNIFGKSVEELVMDGVRNKMAAINEESQVKLQDSMQKIVNDSNGGLVCIII